MKITKVGYSKTYPVNITWEKISIEAEIESGEDARKALYECKRTVESFHYESNKADEKKQEQQPVSSISNDIATCKSLKVLETYSMLVKNKPDLQKAYDKRLDELLNQTIK